MIVSNNPCNILFNSLSAILNDQGEAALSYQNKMRVQIVILNLHDVVDNVIRFVLLDCLVTKVIRFAPGDAVLLGNRDVFSPLPPVVSHFLFPHV